MNIDICIIQETFANTSLRYMMIFIFPVLFLGWKFIKKTKFKRAHEIDLQQDLAEIEHYTANFMPTPDKNAWDKWFNKIFS
jgi:amino acid transporter